MRLIQTEGERLPRRPLEGAVPTAPASDHATLKDAIGRKHASSQTIRKALNAGDRVFYIWGHEGIGKRHLVSRLLAHWQPRPSAVLRISCRTTVEPLVALGAGSQTSGVTSRQKGIAKPPGPCSIYASIRMTAPARLCNR